jgi:hypothetical protein
MCRIFAQLLAYQLLHPMQVARQLAYNTIPLAQEGVIAVGRHIDDVLCGNSDELDTGRYGQKMWHNSLIWFAKVHILSDIQINNYRANFRQSMKRRITRTKLPFRMTKGVRVHMASKGIKRCSRS